MSLSWDGNLLNTPKDIIIDSAIILLTICASVPQLLDPSTSNGISGPAILFAVLFSNAQLSQALLCAAYAWPTASAPVLRQISEGRLTGLEAFGSVLGHLQIFVHWLCTVVVLIAVRISTQIGNLPIILAFLHASIILFPAVAITLPRPSPEHTIGKDIYMALVGFSNIAVAPCSIALQLYFQAQNPGLPTLLYLGLQTLVFTLLAVRWSLRVGKQTWDSVWRFSIWDPPIWMVYEWAFLAANYGLLALGSAAMLVVLFIV